MIGALLLLQQQGPDAHYAGGASSKTAGTTELAGQFFRFLFSTVPQWVQIAGILIGVPVACIVAWQAWKHRRRLWAWWVARSRPVQVSLAGAAFVVAAGGLGSGLYGYNYVMHENDFCQSCHIMDVPWNRFQTTAHKKLECHACHRQPMYVSSVELFWWVTERRMTVPPHDKVPTAVCSECHMRQGTDSARTLVTLTAGHAVHLKSDSSALKHVECVTCHGRDFHVFIPTNATCAQSGCHTQTKVNLGGMSGRGFIHCTLCHDYSTRVDTSVTVAQAKVKLSPQAIKCTKCHEMSEKMRKYDLAADPHKGNCGACHDAHKQKEPKEAYKTCATSQCHGAADTLTAFHRGLGAHALDQCGACHQPHSWKVKGTNCLACHKTINQDRPMPRRVSSLIKPAAHRRSAARRSSALPVGRFASFVHTTSRVRRRDAPRRSALASRVQRSPASDSTFLHSRHKSVECTQCHGTTTTHGGLKFAAPQGCFACHHSAQQRGRCSACHSTASLGTTAKQVSNSLFQHARHASVTCTQCHGTSGTHAALKFSSAAGCRACHHGAQQRAPCSECHTAGSLGQLAASAANPTFAHSRHTSVACADCHGTTTPGGLKLAANTGCLACHHGAQQRAPCATCHATNALDQRALPVTFAISARRDPVTRPLVFAHARHTALACARCHAKDTKRSPTATCMSCHAEHHTAASDCASCHATARTGHDRTAHEGCAHCHTDARVAALQASRPVCLACHQEQRTHYPTGDCATCHALTGRDPARGSGGGP